MFIPTTETPPEWSSDDASNLKSFLSSETGGKVLGLLAYLAPTLLDGADVNKTLVASGEVKGYTLAIETIFTLQTTRPKESEPKIEYPSLDDESAWQDETPTNTK